jgi:hypothetical protein
MSAEAVSAAELACGALDPDKLARIVATYQRDGLCVLTNVLPHDMLVGDARLPV